jgi:hypothetical protein
MRGCFKTFAVIFTIFAICFIAAAGFGGWWSYNNLLSKEPLGVEENSLAWSERQALKVKILPVYQAITKNRTDEFRLSLTGGEANFILKEAFENSPGEPRMKMEFENNSIKSKYTRGLMLDKHLNVEIDSFVRVNEWDYELDLNCFCIGDVCLPESLLAQLSHLVEWDLERRLNSNTSRVNIKELEIGNGSLYCNFITREVHPPDLEEGSTESPISDLK